MGASQKLFEGPPLRPQGLVWWWAQGGTALSSARSVSVQGRRRSSVFVAFPLVEKPGRARRLDDDPWTHCRTCTRRWNLKYESTPSSGRPRQGEGRGHLRRLALERELIVAKDPRRDGREGSAPRSPSSRRSQRRTSSVQIRAAVPDLFRANAPDTTGALISADRLCPARRIGTASSTSPAFGGDDFQAPEALRRSTHLYRREAGRHVHRQR